VKIKLTAEQKQKMNQIFELIEELSKDKKFMKQLDWANKHYDFEDNDVDGNELANFTENLIDTIKNKLTTTRLNPMRYDYFKMQDEDAITLVNCADRYYQSFRNDENLNQSIVNRDREDLLSIARMIEDNDNPKAIANAMTKLDTFVRDYIPEEIYYAYVN